MKQYGMTIGVAVVALVIGFGGGWSVKASKDSLSGVTGASLQTKLQSLGLNAGGSGTPGGGFAGGPAGGAGGFAGRRGGAGGAGGLVAGTVLSKDDQSITVKLTNGSTKTVYFSGTTTVGVAAAGTMDDVAIGKTVTATGTANSDGSVAASSIQVRPAATATPAAQ